MLSSITAKTSIGLDCRFEQHDGCLIRSRNCLPSASTRVHPWCFGGVRVAFHVVLLCVFTFLVSCCDVRYDFHIRTVRLYLQLFVGEIMAYCGSFFCVYLHIVMSNILHRHDVTEILLKVALNTIKTKPIQHFAVAHLFSFPCCVFCFACLRRVSCVPNIASFSLDCPLLITPSGFSNFYLFKLILKF
jgi:hypothetical protein